MRERPVLYLDLDDTVVSWAGGRPHAAPHAREFVAWALERFEVRWLTRWCPDGEMGEKLLGDLARMLDLDVLRFADVRGTEWDPGGSKANGIAWLEHTVLGRPFVWLEDEHGFAERERAILDAHGFLESYWHCNSTNDEQALVRAHAGLSRWLRETADAAA